MNNKGVMNQAPAVISQRSQTFVLCILLLSVIAGVTILLVVATPLRFQMLQADVYGLAEGLETLEVALSFLAAYFVGWKLVVACGSLMVAALIAWKRPDDWYALLAAISLSLYGLLPPLVDGLIYASPRWAMPVGLLRFIEFGCLLALAGQIVRYRRYVPVTEKQQMKWVLFGFLLAAVFSLTISLLLINFPGLTGAPGNEAGMILILGGLYLLTALVLPISFALSILRYRLWDVDILLNRTLVYAGLSLAIVTVYILIVGILGLFFQSQSDFLLALLATGVVAVLFQPLRDRLQKGVNRLMYGQRDEPYQVLTRLGEQLQTTLDMAQTLQLTVEVRELSHRLHPPELALLGLTGALQEQAHAITSFMIHLHIAGDLPPLSAAVETAAYYITLEALANVEKHAQARNCTIQLLLAGEETSITSHDLKLCILDDGSGWPPQFGSGLGMWSMQGRAAEVGGTCVIEAIPEGGVRVLAHLPLPREER